MVYYGGYIELYWVVGLIVLFCGLVLLWLIFRILWCLNIVCEVCELFSMLMMLVIGVGVVVFVLVVVVWFVDELGLSFNVVVFVFIVMFLMKLIGFLMLMLCYEVISYIFGILVLENGIFLGM